MRVVRGLGSRGREKERCVGDDGVCWECGVGGVGSMPQSSFLVSRFSSFLSPIQFLLYLPPPISISLSLLSPFLSLSHPSSPLPSRRKLTYPPPTYKAPKPQPIATLPFSPPIMHSLAPFSKASKELQKYMIMRDMCQGRRERVERVKRCE